MTEWCADWPELPPLADCRHPFCPRFDADTDGLCSFHAQDPAEFNAESELGHLLENR